MNPPGNRPVIYLKIIRSISGGLPHSPSGPLEMYPPALPPPRKGFPIAYSMDFRFCSKNVHGF